MKAGNKTGKYHFSADLLTTRHKYVINWNGDDEKEENEERGEEKKKKEK